MAGCRSPIGLAAVSIYRNDEGRLAIRGWCQERLDRWDRPHRARTVPSTLGPTHVVTTGDGPDLVLLAGTNFAAATWLPFVAALSSHATVHAVDLPGQPGLSGDERAGASAYGPWLRDLLPTLATREPTVVGHSLGAAVALRGAVAGMAARRLVLLDPAGLMSLSVTPAVLRPTIPWLRRPDAATSAGLLRMMMAPGAAPEEELVAWMTLVGRHVRTSLAPRPLPARSLQGLAGTSVDVLSGRYDAFLPAGRLARAVARKLPTATFDAVDGAGHLLPHERPDVVVSRIEAVEGGRRSDGREEPLTSP